MAMEIFDDYESLSENAAELIYERGLEIVERKGEFLLALAGGNTPRLAYQLLAEMSREDVRFWEKTKLYWTDERYVLPDSDKSNYKMARDSLINAVPIPSNNVYPIPTGYDDVNRAASEYEMIFPERMDVVLLGMGADGHIASIFPKGRAVKEKDRRFTYDYAPVEPKLRITATIPVIRAADKIFILVSGNSKREALKRVFADTGSIEETPARAVKDANWLVDRAAAN